MVCVLSKYGFKKINNYVYFRGKDRAYVGTIQDGTWSTALYIGDKSYLFMNDENMEKFFKNEKRINKLDRILLSEK